MEKQEIKTITVEEIANYFGVKVEKLEQSEPIKFDREKIIDAYKKFTIECKDIVFEISNGK